MGEAHGTPDSHGLELQSRSLDALASLLHSLDASTDVDDVAKRALLTLSGQLLVQRAALFVEDSGSLHLRATVGVARERIGDRIWRLPSEVARQFDDSDVGVVDLTSLREATAPTIAANFDRLARLSNASETVGVVLLGGWLGSRELDRSDRQLLRTMGIVIGTTLHRVSVQEQLEQARRRLEQAQIIRKTVMEHVTHEFNTPLMVVKSTVDLLREAEEDDREEFLDMQAEAVERLQNLVGSILQLARESEDDARVRPTPIREIVERVIRPQIVAMGAGDWALGTAANDLDGEIECDATRLAAILGALYSNAALAAGERPPRVWTHIYPVPAGWWELQQHCDRLVDCADSGPGNAPSVEALRDDPEGTERELVIEVVDLGRGIPDADLHRVLEPFAQASNSPRLGVSGAGMGLSTARKLAEELGGRLRLQSREGVGTVVAVLLPFRIAAPGSLGATPPNPAGSAARR